MNPSESNACAEDEGRGPRCLCGHYQTEHAHGGCTGAYATLMADADDFGASVQVGCSCQSFHRVDADYHEPRSA